MGRLPFKQQRRSYCLLVIITLAMVTLVVMLLPPLIIIGAIISSLRGTKTSFNEYQLKYLQLPSKTFYIACKIHKMHIVGMLGNRSTACYR